MDGLQWKTLLKWDDLGVKPTIFGNPQIIATWFCGSQLVFNFRRYRMDPGCWSEALKRDPRVDGHADAWLRYGASNALLSSLLLDWMGYFSVVILKAYYVFCTNWCCLRKMEMGEVSSCFSLVQPHSLWNPMSCTPGCFMLRSWLVPLAKKPPKSVQPFHRDMAMWCLTPACCQALSGHSWGLLGNQCNIYIHTDSPPTVEWGFQSGENSRQEPRWGILDTLDWCMFFYISGKHNRTVYILAKMLGVQRFQWVVWEVGLEKHKGT